ncbi:MAG: hypothetical protein JJU24_08470 [Natronohydrobacter sp.]|nr:hypothetical protein [Natronohydrobacter sp.]
MPMPDTTRWSEPEMLRLAARGVLKVDLMGVRGTTLVTCDELAAMAAVLALSGALPDELLTPKTLMKGPSDV